MGSPTGLRSHLRGGQGSDDGRIGYGTPNAERNRPDGLTRELALAKKAAREAGEILRGY